MPPRPIYQAPQRVEPIPAHEGLVPFSAEVLAHRASILAKRSAEHSEALRQLEAAHAAPDHSLGRWDDEGGRHVARKPAYSRMLLV